MYASSVFILKYYFLYEFLFSSTIISSPQAISTKRKQSTEKNGLCSQTIKIKATSPLATKSIKKSYFCFRISKSEHYLKFFNDNTEFNSINYNLI